MNDIHEYLCEVTLFIRCKQAGKPCLHLVKMATVSRITVCLMLYVLVLLYHNRQVRADILSVPNTLGNLSDYLCGALASTLTDGTTLELNSSVQHKITGESCMWQNRASITMQSSGDTMAIILCDSELNQSGFSFVEMNTFTLRNLKFENCGGITNNANSIAPTNTPPRRAIDNDQHAVLFLARCTDVNIENVVFSNYMGYAVYSINMLGNNRLHQVIVMNSFAFVNKMMSTRGKSLMYSGSGLFFHFSDKLSLEATSDTSLNISNSTISNNFNIYPDFYIHSLQDTRLQNQPDDFPLHGAGGLTVHFEQQNRKVVARIETTHLVNNGGSAGGGIIFVTKNTIDNSDIIITACTFVNNSIYKYGSFFTGGGLQLEFVFSYSELTQVYKTAGTAKAIMKFENITFQNNSGDIGGAVAVFTEAQNVSAIKINFKSVRFINNEATIEGDCINVESENSAIYSEIRPHLILESIVIHQTGSFLENDLDSSAALSFNNIFATIIGNPQNPSIISNGKDGGLKLFNTYAFLKGDVSFINNSATKGGAIDMEANSYLLFQEPAHILFQNNKAMTGGAIYSNIVRGVQCVMQFISPNNENVTLNSTQLEQLDFSITFIDNRAERDGDAIYAQPIFNCSWFSESIVQIPTDELTDIYESLYHFQIDQVSVAYQVQMRSHPYNPCFCKQNETLSSPICDPDFDSNVPISVPPGRSFIIPIVPADEMRNSLRSVVELQILELYSNDGIQFQNNQSHLVIDLNGTSCYPLKLILHNAENTTIVIKLSIQTTTGNSISIPVDLEQCPFGFQLSNLSGICDCVQLFAQNNIQCDIEEGLFIKPKLYWIGRTKFEDNNIPACAVRCPRGYCQRRSHVSLSFDNQCNGSRTGELCGQCKLGLSMQFGTTDCKKCSNYWLLTIVLYILSGIILVVCLFLLRLTITEGLLGSILFYAQLFSINIGLLVFSNETRFTTVFISLLNLELGFPLCFYDGMTQVGKHGLQFVFPVYLWLIVAVITILSRYSSKIADLVGSECSKVFVTLIYFSYTKLQRTATEVFIFATIATDTDHKYTVWFYDGGEKYFHGWHLALGLVSIFFLIFILTPYMFSMILSQWCIRISWISRHFKPFIDATLAPFKDRWRFWFGLRLFIINFMILISVLVTPLNSDAVIYAHLVIITLLLVFQAHFKPFKSKVIHCLELFFLINYMLYLIGCLFIFSVIKPTRETEHIYVTAVEVTIIGSAFIVFVVTIVCHLILRVKNYYKQKKGQFTLEKLEHNVETEMESPVNSITLNSSYSISNSDQLRQRNVTLTIVEISKDHGDGGAGLRESLLADY